MSRCTALCDYSINEWSEQRGKQPHSSQKRNEMTPELFFRQSCRTSYFWSPSSHSVSSFTAASLSSQEAVCSAGLERRTWWPVLFPLVSQFLLEVQAPSSPQLQHKSVTSKGNVLITLELNTKVNNIILHLKNIWYCARKFPDRDYLRSNWKHHLKWGVLALMHHFRNRTLSLF